MTLIGTTIGALMALVPVARRAMDKAHPRFIAGYDAGLNDARLEAKGQKLARSNARLIDHIQSLERELLTERHLTQTRIEEIEDLNRDLSVQRHLAAHWRDEAMRVARVSRELQQLEPPPTPSWEQMSGRNALAYPQQNVALAQQNMLGAQQAQAFYWGAEQQLAAQNQHAQAQLAYNAQAQAQQQAFGFCNCVPSRAQVWAEESHDLARRVALLNQEE